MTDDAAEEKPPTADGPVEWAQRRAIALRLRARRWGYRRIGEHLGICTTRAYQLVSEELANIPREEREQLRDIELATLDRLAGPLERILRKGSTLDTIETLDENDEPCTRVVVVRDTKVAVEAAGALIKLSARRCRLLGLDAPTKHDVGVNLAVGEATPARAREIMAELFGSVGPKDEAAPDGQAGAADAGVSPEGAPAK